MKKSNKKTIILVIACIFVFVSLFSVFSNPYRTERIKLYVKSTISTIVNNN